MKKVFLKIVVVLFAVIFLLNGLSFSKMTYAATNVDDLVKPSIIYATMKYNSGGFKAGQKVQILYDHNNGGTYEVLADGKYGTVIGSSVSIPPDPATNTVKMSKKDMEEYINSHSFFSSTSYFIWVDIDRQVLNLFKGSKGKWKLVKSISCATGKNKTPTRRGTFTVTAKGKSFGSYSSLGAKNYLQFSGPYMIHSVPYQYGHVADYTLGKRASHGCVRIAVNESKWMYNNIKIGTTVWTN